MLLADGADLAGQRATNAADPTAGSDLGTKTYIDTRAGLRLRYLGAWSSLTAYAVNDVVIYNGCTFTCITAVAAGGAAPDADATDWAALGGSAFASYYEEWALGNSTAANATTDQLKGNAQSKLIGAASCYTAGTGAWTAPADGVYEIVLNASCSLAGTTAATRVLWTLATGASNGGTVLLRDDKPPSAAANSSATAGSLKRFLTAGTTIYAAVICSGGNQTITATAGQISFHRVL